MTQGCDGKNNSGFFSQKFYTVLLAAFVFVMGMITPVNAEANTDIDKYMNDLNKQLEEPIKKAILESLLIDVWVPVENTWDFFKIEGAKNLKDIYVKNKDGEDDFDKVVGEVAKGQKIRAHLIYKVYPLATVNEKRRAKGYDIVEYYNWTCTVNLTAKNGDKVVQSLQKTYKNTQDNFIEYQVTKDITQVEIKFNLNRTGKVANREVKHDNDDYIIILTVNDELKPVPISSTKKTSTDKNATDKTADNKSGANQPAENSGNERNAGVGEDDIDELPDSDAAKAAAAVGTALGGGLLGGIGGAMGGTAGGGTGGTAGGADGSGEVEEEPETLVYKDPATKAEILYEKDPETGEWVNPVTKGVLDMDDLDRFTRQREADKKWMDDQMDNLRNRDTDLDRTWRKQDQEAAEKMQKDFADIDYQGAKDRLAVKTGTYGMSDAERDDFLKGRQKRLENKQEMAHQNANNWDRVVKVTEGVEKAADIGVDVLSKVTAPAGGEAIADAYTMTKNVAKNTSEAIAEGKSVIGGISKGLSDGAIDIAQNHAKGLGQVAADIGGEAFKGGMEAAWKGENITQGALNGSLKGTMKLGIEKVGDAISKGLNNSVKDSWKNAKDHADKIRKDYSPHISRKSADALHKMNLDKYTDHLKKAGNQDLANTIGNAVAKNTLPDATFGSDD